MKERFRFYSLVIETTRRCNVRCDHCMRGNPEDLDMPMTYIERLFSKTNYISDLTFTGGEPSMAVEQLLGILELAKEYEVDVGNFYVATNALKVPDDFLAALVKWYAYCSDNEITQVQWSNDEFHEIPQESIKKLKAFTFASAKYYSESDSGVIREGRGVNLNGDCTPDKGSVEIEADEDEVTIEGTVYLNCEGNLIAGCDWSFDSQRNNDEIIICPVEKLSLKNLKKWEKENEND